MSRAFRQAAAILSCAVFITSWPARALADPAACAASAEDAQTLRANARLIDARKELVACARSECPSYVRHDCTRWLDEIEATIPSIVVRARDESGGDVLEGELTVDGVASAQLGMSVVLDPGPHVVRLSGGRHAGEQRVLVALGERNRLIVLTVTSAAADPLAARPSETPREHRPLPWVLGGVGAASLVVFGALQLSAQSQYDDLESRCAPACASRDADPIRTKVTISAVALGVGVIALGAAAYLWLTSPRSTR